VRHPPAQRADLIRIALMSAGAVLMCAAGLYAGVTPWQPPMTMVGAAAYHVLAGLDARAPHVQCDHIQTGEAAAGGFTLIAVTLFITGNPIAIAGAVLAVMFAYQVFLRYAIAPDAKEASIVGGAVQAVIAVIIARIAWNAAQDISVPAGRALTGLVPSLPAGPAAPAVAVPVILAAYALSRLLGPELKSHAEGPEFCCLPGREYSVMTWCLIAARCALVTIALLFSGWLCGIGFSAGRLYRGTLPGIFNLMALLAFSLAMLLVSKAAGTFIAAAGAYAASYALFFLYIKTRGLRYDRRETV